MVGRQVEVLVSEVVHDGVNLDNRCVDSVAD